MFLVKRGLGLGVSVAAGYTYAQYSKFRQFMSDMPTMSFDNFDFGGFALPTYKEPGEQASTEQTEPAETFSVLKTAKSLFSEQNSPPSAFNPQLVRQLVEISLLLNSVKGTPIQLPQIVVIGSQSSGKSSVLESIVGFPFLPKGATMTTKRPIHLQLTTSPTFSCEFPDLGLKFAKIEQVEQTLTDLNAAVEEIDAAPIQLIIRSPNVPNLGLVDLPGYIQVTSTSQSPQMKQHIATLCQKYITESNIILAVCAANVDLANSEALLAARAVDPKGLRTIGVLTKMDLVDPPYGLSLLNNTRYPLQLGYIGVANSPRSPNSSTELISMSSQDGFFAQHPLYPPAMVGTQTLRTKLETILHEHVITSLGTITDRVKSELDDARYEFKVKYNDRSVSAESYLVETLSDCKKQVRQLSSEFAKPALRKLVGSALESRLLDICYQLYYDNQEFKWSTCASSQGEEMLQQATSLLTRSNVGKSTVQIVSDVLEGKISEIFSQPPWNHHKSMAGNIQELSESTVKARLQLAIDQVENTIKPYKFEIEVSPHEWQQGQQRALDILTRKAESSKHELMQLKSTLGRRRLRLAMKQADPDPDARKAIALRGAQTIIEARKKAIANCTFDSRTCCPETYLSVLAEKLTYTACLFIYLELVNEYFYLFPRLLDEKGYKMDRAAILEFGRENPKIQAQIDSLHRFKTLESVHEKLAKMQR